MTKDVAKLRRRQRARRCIAVIVLLSIYTLLPSLAGTNVTSSPETPHSNQYISERVNQNTYTLATEALGSLAVKEALSGDDYKRSEFAPKWGTVEGCDVRNRILARDLESVTLDSDNCTVLTGTLALNHFSGSILEFDRSTRSSKDIHIEHLVAVSDAWRKGGQSLSKQDREQFYNDPLNLLAVDGLTNIQKGDKDAAAWLPETTFRCRYIARQIAVKKKYSLWVTPAEKQAMETVLATCPLQVLPIQMNIQ